MQLGRDEVLIELAEHDGRHAPRGVGLELDGAVRQRVFHVRGLGMDAPRRDVQDGRSADGDDPLQPAREWFLVLFRLGRRGLPLAESQQQLVTHERVRPCARNQTLDSDVLLEAGGLSLHVEDKFALARDF